MIRRPMPGRAVPFLLVAQGEGIVEGVGRILARLESTLGSRVRCVAIPRWNVLIFLLEPSGDSEAADRPPEVLEPARSAEGSAAEVSLRVALLAGVPGKAGAEIAIERSPGADAVPGIAERSDVFVLHDAGRGAWTLGRGRTGLRTLYYLASSGRRDRFVACTQLRPLLPFMEASPALDLDGIRRYLCNGFFSDPETPFADARSVLPGEILGRIGPGAAWRRLAGPWPARAGLGASSADGRAPNELLRERLVRAVASRTEDLEEVACLLSGGVDSSTVAAVAARILGKKVRTYSLVFEDEALSEAKYATAVARRIGARHENVLLKKEDFEDSLDWFLHALDLPSADAVNSLLISRAIAHAGHDAALCGVGSDELFGGHECMRRVPRALSFLHAYRRAPSLARAAFRGAAAVALGVASEPWLPSRGLRGKFVDLLGEPEDALAVYLLSRRVLMPAAVDRIMPGAGRADFRSVPASVAGPFEGAVRGESLTRKLSFFERHVYLENQLVRDLGMVSVATGLDLRLPFLDQELVDTVWGLPESEVFLEGRPKTFLIRAVADVLPSEAYERPKLGFVLPIGQWLGGAVTSRLRGLTGAPDLLERVGVDPRMLERIVQDCARARGRIFFTREWCLFVLLDWTARNLPRAGAG